MDGAVKFHCRLAAISATMLFLAPSFADEASGAADQTGGPEKTRSLFFDPQDGKVDLSEWLLDKKGFLPVPTIITEPAVGYGVGLGVLFFRQSMSEALEQTKKTGHIKPPDIYALAVAGTENGTKVLAGGAFLTFLDDRWRYRGIVGRTDLNLDFYGLGGTLGKDLRLAYKLDGLMSSQQGLYRLGETDNFVGLRWIYLNMSSRFDNVRDSTTLPSRSFSSTSSGLGLSFEHDSRDNIFTPSRGTKAALDTLFYDPGIGSDNRFQSYRAHILAYIPTGKSVVLGARLDARAARGDVPFYQLPYIDLRGVPVVRYQNSNAAVAEAEVRWSLDQRWGLIGFAGAGRTWGQGQSFGEASDKVSKGFGFRYQIARVLGLWMGMDFAWGPDGERAFYIQTGNAWR